MPVTTTCPDCRRDLRVPDHLIGTLVRCPHCRMEFTAEGPTPSTPKAEETRSPDEAFRPGKTTESSQSPSPEQDETASLPIQPAPEGAFRSPETEAPADAPAPGPMPLPPRPNLDDDDEDDDDLDERFDEARRRRIESESYDNAKRRVLAPAIGLMVVGALGLGIDAIRIIVLIIQFASGAFAGPAAGPFGDAVTAAAIAFGSLSLCILWASLVLYAGIKLKQLRSFGMVIAGSIIAMLPCFDACCILGLPFAIWTLVIIYDDAIRRHFKP